MRPDLIADFKCRESKDKPTFDGHRCYQFGTGGLPHVKGGMPVHVRSVV